jgi:hypothetical protein
MIFHLNVFNLGYPVFVFYFYQILTTFNNFKILSEVAHGNAERLKLFPGFASSLLWSPPWPVLTVMKYLCHKWPWMFSICRNHNLNLSSFMTYYRVCNKSNATRCGVGTTYPSGTHGCGQFCPICSYDLSVIVCPFVLFLLTITVSGLLPFTDSDYPFGIFKVVLHTLVFDLGDTSL